MALVNEYYLRLPGSYLFADIAKRVQAFKVSHPKQRVISLGIGDVTRPLAPAVVEAMHKAADEMAHKETFRGYGPEHGYDFLREAILKGDFLTRGIHLDKDEIFVNDGAKSDTANIQELLRWDNSVALTDPVYPVYVDSNAMIGRAGKFEGGKWTDITYLPYNGTFAYLSTILDAYTKQILAYVVSNSLEEDFVIETIENLVRDHGISLHAETIIHSDQGSHYTARSFIDILHSKSLKQSMSRRGNCWDNAPQESFFGHMKDHIRSKLKECRTFADVKAVIDDYMDYYNNDRYQWKLAKLSPNEFYSFVTTGIYPLKVPNAPAVPGHLESSQQPK